MTTGPVTPSTESTARSAFLAGDHRFDVRAVELPEPGPGELLLDVAACGVCGSNLHEWHATRPGAAGTRVAGATGHEVSGVVAAVGTGVEQVAVGDRVAVDPSAAQSCGRCQACLDGANWFCRNRSPLATYGFADRMVLFAAAAHPLPAGMDVVVGSLAEPMACGVHAVRHSWTARDGRVDGKKVAVIGAGMLGLSAIMAARHLGASEVAAIARHPHQQAAAWSCGATSVLDPVDEETAATVRRMRPELVVEAVGGAGGTFAMALEMAAWRGEVAVLGSFLGPQAVNVAAALNHEKRLFFAISYAALDGVHDMDVALEIMGSGAVPVADLVTHRYHLDELEQAFTAADDKSTGALRVAVVP